MTQERTPRAALDTKDNKNLTVPWYRHHDIIIYFLVLHKPIICENFNLVAMEADKKQKFPCFHFQPF